MRTPAPDIRGDLLAGDRHGVLELWRRVHPNGPQPVVQKFYREVAKALEVPEVKSRLAAIGTQPGTSPPEEFQNTFRAEVQKWAKLAKEVGVRPE